MIFNSLVLQNDRGTISHPVTLRIELDTAISILQNIGFTSPSLDIRKYIIKVDELINT